MKAIQFIYEKNIITRNGANVHQHLVFSMAVENLDHHKMVEVLWSGKDGIWHILKAEFQRGIGNGHYEVWQAGADFHAVSGDNSLPGDIQFALHCQQAGKEYWDNNDSLNYAAIADSGVQMAEELPLLNVDFQARLKPGQQYYPVTVVARQTPHPKKVYIRWTTDHWKHTHTTKCFFNRRHYDNRRGSNARNPNRYGSETWINQLRIDDAYRVEYAIARETNTDTVWDNNYGCNYIARHERLKILTLNLHCYQEENQDAKFSQIAKAINDLDIDIVCLQEVGEVWNDNRGDWESNAANIIRQRLLRDYDLYFDWSHIGFGQYREGSAILSKHPIVTRDSAYVSSSRDMNNINARRIVMTQLRVRNVGLVNVCSVHLSWWAGGFREQLENLMEWAEKSHSMDVVAAFLCGDFNNAAGTEGYLLAAQKYEDLCLAANQRDFHEAGDDRIDYIFINRGGKMKAVSARLLFTDDEYGKVSDHPGCYVELEPM